MQRTLALYSSAGWPLPPSRIPVDSPLAGVLLLAQLFRRAESQTNWHQLWGVFWDSLPLTTKRFSPRVAVPAVAARGLQRLPTSAFGFNSLQNLRWNQRDTDPMTAVVDRVLFEELEAERSIVGSEGRRLWEEISQRLRPSLRISGVCGWAYTAIAIECAEPQLFRDDRGRLHREDGPAIQYPDGWGAFLWHGVAVPSNVVLQPESITAAQVDNTTNAETRRIMIERMGAARYVQESQAVPVSSDRFGTLYRKDVEGDDPIYMVKLINSTPEPDGSFAIYWLRVPPTVRTPKEAVAWTFGMTADEYDPLVET